MREWMILAALLAVGAPAQAQQPVTVTNTAVGQAVSVRCVDTTGATFEACGGSGGGGGGTSSTVGAAVPSTATAAGASDGTNMQLFRVFDGDSGAGSQWLVGTMLRKSASGGTVEAGTSSDPLRVDPTGTTTQPVSLATGSNLAGYVGDKNTFGSKVTVTTTTNFTSLGSGSGWSGGAITTSGCADIRFRVKTKGSSASNTLYVDFYLASSIAGETTFDDAASATADQAFTASNRQNSRYVGGVKTNSTNAVTGSFSALDAFPTLPGAIVPIAINSSGAALSSTSGDHVIDYECVN